MREKPTILARRMLAQSRLFQIDEIDLRFANGHEARYESLSSPGHGAVLIVPILDNETLLLVEEYAVGVDRYELTLPKGRMEANESPLETANRELAEEVGFTAARLDLLTRLTLAPGYSDHHTHIVLARDLSPCRREGGDEPEPPGVVPWPLHGLGRLVALPQVSEARTIAALYLARDYLYHASTP
jgi:ADP-ribose diphosphatase